MQGDYKTEIIKVKGDWREVVDDCRSTVGKAGLGKNPSQDFKKKILIAEHSPIRDIKIKWKWNSIKSWIATHWSRHKWECFIKTQRSDRTNVDRDKSPQDTLVTFTGEANTQHLIDTWRKRLCYQAHPETRMYAESFKAQISPMEMEISDVLVPNCVYRGGCPEMKTCGFYEQFLREYEEDADMSNIQSRYAAYNDLFWKKIRD